MADTAHRLTDEKLEEMEKRLSYGGCRKVGNMDASEAINSLTNHVVAAVNGSHLHPAIVRLVLLNVLHAVEDQERTMAQPEAVESRQTGKESDVND